MTTNADKLREIIGAGIYYLDRVLIPASESLPTSQQVEILGRVVDLKDKARLAGEAFQDGFEAIGIVRARAFLDDCIALEARMRRSGVSFAGYPLGEARSVMRRVRDQYSLRGPSAPPPPVASPVAPASGPSGSGDALGILGLALGLAGLIMKGRK